MTPPPKGLTQMAKRCAPGWRSKVVHGRGILRRQRNDPNLHKRITSMDPCSSWSLRLRHLDGRAAVGVWVQPDDGKATFDGAWAWTTCTDPACSLAGIDHPAGVPQSRTSTALSAYLSEAVEPVELGAAV